MRVVVGYQWLDELSPHELMAKQTALDNTTDKPRSLYEALLTITRNLGSGELAHILLAHRKVLRGCCCEPSKNARAQPVNAGSGLFRAVGRIVELLEEPREVCAS